MKNQHSFKFTASGFTIVELLIVIIVISILATLTSLTYVNVQNTSKTKGAAATAAIVAHKIEAYGSLTNSYPNATTADAYTTALNAYTESKLPANEVKIGTPDSGTGTTTVEVSQCTTGTAGAFYRVRYWDYDAKGLSSTASTGSLTPTDCTQWTPLR